MPSRKEFDVISDFDHFGWGFDGDKHVFFVSSRGEYSSRRVYFPAVGSRYQADYSYSGDTARYWTSTFAQKDSSIEFQLRNLGGEWGVSKNTMAKGRYYGSPIRAVTE